MQKKDQKQEKRALKEIDVSKLSDKLRAYFEAREALIAKYAKPKVNDKIQ